MAGPPGACILERLPLYLVTTPWEPWTPAEQTRQDRNVDSP